MIRVKLREAMDKHGHRTGRRVTYASLAASTGLSSATLEAIGSRPDYNPTLGTIEKLCRALECDVSDLLELAPGAATSP